MTDTATSFQDICIRLQELALSLVAVCDGAQSEDNQGYSKSHAAFGRVMAYTPTADWTAELAEQAVETLLWYSKRQLSAHRDTLAAYAEAVKKGHQDAKHGAVRARLGLEQGKLTVVSAGYGHTAEEKKVFQRALKDAGFAHDSKRSAWHLVPDKLTTDQVASLRGAIRDGLLTNGAEAELLVLEKQATATTHYVDAYADGTVRVVFDYDRALLDSFKAATDGMRRSFRGDNLPKHWAVYPRGTEAKTLLSWADAHSLVLLRNSRELLEGEARQDVVPFNPKELYVAGDNLVLPVTTFNRELTTWVQANWNGVSRFSKIGPDGATGAAVSPCWLLRLPRANLAKPLLTAPSWGNYSWGLYTATPEVLAAMQRADAALEQLAPTVQLSSAASTDFKVSRPIGGAPYPFQVAGVEYALKTLQPNKGVLIGDEMGLGKSMQALITVNEKQAFPCIVVCPAVAKLNWARETRRWLPSVGNIVVVSGRKQGPLPKADVYVVNYDLLHSRIDDLLAVNAKAVVADEIHYVKDAKARRSVALTLLVRGELPKVDPITGSMVLDARGKQAIEQVHPGIETRLGLSGTAILNRPIELVQPLSLLGRLEDFGGFWNFAKRFCSAHKDENGYWNMSGASNGAECNTILRATCYIRREKSAVIPELPAKQSVEIPVQLSNRAEYRAVERDAKYTLDKEGNSIECVIAQMSRLRLAAGLGMVKPALDWIADFLESSDKKLVVFAYHTEVQHQLYDELTKQGVNPLRITGDMNMVQRQAAVDSFQVEGGSRVIVCSLKAASEAITLTAASHVLIVEPDWTPARMEQAGDRCHRIGQKDSVTVYYLLAEESIHQDIWLIVQGKRGVIQEILQGVERSGDDRFIAALVVVSFHKRLALSDVEDIPEEEILSKQEQREAEA